MLPFCSAILGKECLLNGLQLSETAWLCQLKHRKSLYQKPGKPRTPVGSWAGLPSISSHQQTLLHGCHSVCWGFSCYDSSWILIVPFSFPPGAFHWCLSAAHWSQFEGNHKVMVVVANLATPELCSDWEMIQDPFVLECWGSCRSYRKPVLEELNLHSYGNLETSE